ISSLHLEYQLWTRELIFYKEEIKIFENHLEGLVNRNTGFVVHAQVEHYQNQFILHKEVIDHLKHDLHVSEKQLAAFVHDLSGAGIEGIKMDNHTKLRERMIIFRKLYKELKTEFRRFEMEWM
ncbi:MAG TPA: hypothetical protein VEB42_01605, partial [Chitinophagaceae bacterium]|nr:hypothetical protein [Chitinophagaceae bacterium]